MLAKVNQVYRGKWRRNLRDFDGKVTDEEGMFASTRTLRVLVDNTAGDRKSVV